MSKPIFEDLFLSSEERRNRKSYLLAFLIMVIVVAVFAGARGLAKRLMEPSDLKFTIVSILSCFLLPAMWSIFSSTAQRFRDFEWSGWWAMSLLLPPIFLILILLLVFRPGTKGDNKYGMDPLAQKTSTREKGNQNRMGARGKERKDPHF